jgi:hypothetical protein
MSSEMIRGESVLVVKSYDLFDRDVLDCKGIYIKTDTSSSKHLIFFPVNQEWAEMSDEFIERIDPGHIPEDNENFIKNVATLQYSFET